LLVVASLVGCGGGTAPERSAVTTTVPGVDEAPLVLATPPVVGEAFPVEGAPVPQDAGDPTETGGAMRPAAPVALTEHTVQAGDTLLGIAMAYDVPMAAVQLQNDMGASTVVQAGQVLAVPDPAAWTGASPFWVTYEVTAGDTLSELGAAYDVEVAELQAVNDLGAGGAIRVGQLLVLPVEGPAVARVVEPTATPQPTATPIILPTPTPTPGAGSAPTATLGAPQSQSTPVPTSPPVAGPPSDVADWPREVVRLMNEVRAQHGLPPLAYNETLARAAQAHAEDCTRRGSCSHTGSDGSTIKERVRRAGYDGRSWAECWAQRQTPQGAIDIWMDEVYPQEDGTVLYGPHRRTLLTDWFDEIGVGVSKTTWGYYFIADFGKTR
jgi:uncharacterized protein YkwD